jgi:hypothetical protein
MRLTTCPACGRAVTMLRDGERCNHGPGPDGEFICAGSGDQQLVAAAGHLNVERISPRSGKRPVSASIATRTTKEA